MVGFHLSFQLVNQHPVFESIEVNVLEQCILADLNRKSGDNINDNYN